MSSKNHTRDAGDRSPQLDKTQQSQTKTRFPAPLFLQRAYEDPSTLTPADVKHLQRTIGNRAVIGILSRHTGLQTKLNLGPAGDQYEQEADRVAEQVVRQIDSAPVQRVEDEEELQMKPLDAVQRIEDEEELQMKPLADNISRVQRSEISAPPIRRAFMIRRDSVEEEELLQGKYNHGPEGGEVDPTVTSQIQSARSGGRPLDDSVRGSMESGFGADFSGVRVHNDSESANLNRSLNARAFTVGSDIFFGGGEYNPGSSGGKELLAHELTHTVQQGAVQARRTFEKPVISGISGSLAALQRVFDANDPATFDNDGGHGYGDHGPQTTEEQHKTRLKTGTAPSGRSADIPPSSSKFASVEVMKSAIGKAVTDAAKDSVSKGSKRSKKRITLAYNIKNAGISYQLDSSDANKTAPTNVDWVVIILEQTGAGKWDKQYDKIITMFPSATAPAQQDN